MKTFYIQLNNSDEYIAEVKKGPVTTDEYGFDTNWSFTKTKIKSNAQIFNNEDEFVKDHANAFGNSDFIRIYD